MKKVTVKTVLLIAWSFFFILPIMPYFQSPAYAASASLILSPATGTFNKGCNFSVEIKLDTGEAQTDGTDAILFFDPTRLNATSIRSGTIYPDYPGNNIDSQNGKITVSGLSSVATAFTGSGTLATIDFTVLESAPTGVTQVKFDFDPNDKAKTTDSNVVERGTVADILSQVGNANFTIGSGSCTIQGGGTVGGGQGGAGDSGTIPTKKPVPTLPPSADFTTTWVVAAVGGMLTILGLIGLALL